MRFTRAAPARPTSSVTCPTSRRSAPVTGAKSADVAADARSRRRATRRLVAGLRGLLARAPDFFGFARRVDLVRDVLAMAPRGCWSLDASTDVLFSACKRRGHDSSARKTAPGRTVRNLGHELHAICTAVALLFQTKTTGLRGSSNRGFRVFRGWSDRVFRVFRGWPSGLALSGRRRAGIPRAASRSMNASM